MSPPLRRHLFYAPALRRTVLVSAGLAVLSCIVFPFWVVGCVDFWGSLCIDYAEAEGSARFSFWQLTARGPRRARIATLIIAFFIVVYFFWIYCVNNSHIPIYVVVRLGYGK